MLFRKRIEKSCSYCRYGTKIDEEQVLCIKKGVVPVKPKAMDFSKYNNNDYSL